MTPLAWPGIVRLGLVQSALGAIVMLATSLLNRVMVVEYALPAVLPGALVGWHYAVQLSRPRWGHGSDLGRRRTPWIVTGIGVLAMGGVLATNAVVIMAAEPVWGIALAIVAYTMIGAGVGAGGTSLLALLATRVAPTRRPAAAALTWIMMIAGIVLAAGISSQLLDPFSPERLAMVAGAVAIVAFLVALLAVWGVEGPTVAVSAEEAARPAAFGATLRAIWAEPVARRFTLFVFVSMLAYNLQDLVLEPFAGLVFGMTVGQSTGLSGMHQGGVLLGMILVGVSGGAFGNRLGVGMRAWIVGGCAASAVALSALAAAAATGPGWPLGPTVFALGLGNGVFAVAAIGAMMTLAGERGGAQAGARMGLWGAAQAIGFGLGGLLGASGVDAGRAAFGNAPDAFGAVFAVEALLFVGAALMALRLGRVRGRAAAIGFPLASRA